MWGEGVGDAPAGNPEKEGFQFAMDKKGENTKSKGRKPKWSAGVYFPVWSGRKY